MRRSQRDTAFHESAHAVAHVFYPLAGGVMRLTIRGAELDAYNAKLHRVNRARGLCTPKRTLPPVRNGIVVDPEALRHELLCLLAGEAADFVRDGHGPHRVSARAQARARRDLAHADEGDDLSRALNLLSAAHPFDERAAFESIPEAERRSPAAWQPRVRLAAQAHQAEIDAQLEALRRAALAFVASRWPHVSAVADALLRQGTLEGDEVTEIIEGVEARLREGPPPLGWGKP